MRSLEICLRYGTGCLLQYVLENVIWLDIVGLPLKVKYKAVTQHGDCDRLDVVMGNMVPLIQDGVDLTRQDHRLAPRAGSLQIARTALSIRSLVVDRRAVAITREIAYRLTSSAIGICRASWDISLTRAASTRADAAGAMDSVSTVQNRLKLLRRGETCTAVYRRNGQAVPSGNGYVPSISTGFWVAITKNRSGSACVHTTNRH